MTPTIAALVDVLLKHEEPCIQWGVRTRVLGEDPASRPLLALSKRVLASDRAQTLLARVEEATASPAALDPRRIYSKWQGLHWLLAALSGLGIPPGNRRLKPARDALLEHWLGPQFRRVVEVATRAKAYEHHHDAVPLMAGRHRRCASQQGNLLLSLTRLGLIDSRATTLVELLLGWQWPDGGWNCDKEPNADTSSFMETLLPMRGLSAFSKTVRHEAAGRAARSAAEVFLTRRLFRRRANGKVIRPDFVELHYPLYWHYDYSGGLVGMLEVGCLDDDRCADALDLLESKRLSDGGWPAEKSFYKVAAKPGANADYLRWGGTGKKRMNPWVSVDALSVLVASGRVAI
jgi:hypothetical protein